MFLAVVSTLTISSNQRPSWESDEKDLVLWTKQQASSRNQQTKATTRSNREDALGSHQSTSVPAQPPLRGIASLGMADTDMERKRNKQREYAESLMAQIKEKEQTKQKDTTVLERKTQPDQTSDSFRPDARELPKTKTRSKSPKRNECDYYLPYPPPPPQFPHYPSPHHPYPYMNPFYGPPPPPRDMYYQARVEGRDRPDSYMYPYYPPQDPRYTLNPYLPPHVPAHVKPFDERAKQVSLRAKIDLEHKHRESREETFEGNEELGETSPIHGGGDKPKKQNKSTYRKELEKQMQEKKQRDLKSKIDRERYEKSKELEIYDPFGKGGCGAPVRDQHGNLVADLKQMKKINDEKLSSPRESYEFSKLDCSDGITRKSSDQLEQTVLKYDKVDDGAQKKVVQESYRDFLKKQVEEKEALIKKQKEEQVMEEKRELERIENDRLKLMEAFKVEREKERQREEEAHRKNEEMKKEAEEKKKEVALKEQEAKLLEEQEARARAGPMFTQQTTHPVNTPQEQYRTRSPPVPTLRKQQQRNMNTALSTPQSEEKTSSYPSSSFQAPTYQRREQIDGETMVEQTSVRSSSPPIPTVRKRLLRENVEPTAQQVSTNIKTVKDSPPGGAHQSTDTTPSDIPVRNTTTPSGSTILTQLVALRMHLQSQLAEQDRQQVQTRLPPRPKVASGPLVRHQHSGGTQLPPLQGQHGVLSRIQEERVEKLKNSHRGKENKPEISSSDLLTSDSIGGPLKFTNPFDEDPTIPHFLKSNPHPDPAHLAKARYASAGELSRFSIATPDVKYMAARNEERMRRLDAILNAGVDSHTGRGETGDSQTILNVLQRRDRQSSAGASERSLDCEVSYQRLSSPNS